MNIEFPQVHSTKLITGNTTQDYKDRR